MKAFNYASKFIPEYPEDLSIIRGSLECVGDINPSITEERLDDLYREFCDMKYSASWLDISEEIIDEFTKYLSKKDI
jgi:hypothetical protein